MLPQWIKKNPGLVFTPSPEFDQILKVLLETSMFVGGFLGFLLDNTIPGSPEERGLIAWEAQHQISEDSDETDSLANCYDLPVGMSFLREQNWSRYVPFLPTFRTKTK